MSIVVEKSRLSETRIAGLLTGIRSGNIWLWRTVVAMIASACVLLAFQLFDPRLINGVNVWDKPVKFFLSLAIQYGTVSWALSLLPSPDCALRRIRWPVALMLIAGWAEMGYIIFRASRGEASHFNSTSLSGIIGYALMGVGSLTLTFTAAFIGITIWRKRGSSLWRQAAGLGLMVGAALGTIAGAYMSAQSGHWVGGVASDAHGLPLFGWSTSGGDLRVAHFIGLHAAQIIPLAALSGDRRVVYGVSVAIVLLTGIIFMVGASGIPLFRA